MSQHYSIAIIVLNWNGLVDTLACLASLRRVEYPDYTVIVVDNASTDDSVATIKQAHPDIVLLENSANLGYVGGNNAGITYAQQEGFDAVLLLNNDTEVAPDFLQQLVDVAQANPQVGIVGPLIYYFSQPATIWSAGGAIDWQRGLTHMIGLNQPDVGQFGQMPYPVDFVTGCALLIKMPVIEQIGRLDSRFFAYYEETEWCVRAKKNGYEILLVPQAKLWHKISPQARAASPQVHYYMTRNRLLFLWLAQAGLLSRFNTLYLDYVRTLLSWSLKPRWKHKAPQKKAMLQAIVDYHRGRFGQVDVTHLATSF